MRRALRVAGVVLVALGLLFAAQGSGVLPYPAESAMVGRSPWVWRGLALAAAGAAAVWAGRRRS